jgi:preprotein translocase subunit SecA
MFMQIAQKIFGSRSERLVKQYRKIVQKINALEPDVARLTDAELRAKTDLFKERLKKGETLDDLLPEAFAVVREAGKRALSMRHFDVQLIGGINLHQGKISEMRTGEGKTLVATLPAYLNALTGRGVHVVTVNDYLAKRDAEWMGKLYRFLGLEVGVNVPGMSPLEKKKAYAADITYGTNNEFGFDYLRDNLVYSIDDRVQRDLYYAIVDEVDSILSDEARTPLIISGEVEDHTQIYQEVDKIAAALQKAAKEGEEGDFVVDEKAQQVLLTESGHEHAERLMAQMGLIEPGSSLYDIANVRLMHYLNAALKAHYLYFRDQHYVVQDGAVIIVDEFTGRLMAGRRWSDGLHQAVEAKERVPIQQENRTLASITFQNYFRMYEKLAGMTGTAATEAEEFEQIYNLETVIIPTHRPMIRQDRHDKVYRTAKEKYQAILEEIKAAHERGQPVLVGTTSIENSEIISKLLKKEKLPHEVLNAKQHAREAHIIAQAGRPGAITIATNMAGRGTDIVLGGNPELEIEAIMADQRLSPAEKEQKVAALKEEWQKNHEKVLNAGGLHVIGTERHESRRVDNQLRGRSGRQGDPGSTQFFLSLEDNLLRIFASDRIGAIMQRLKMPEGEAIEHPWVSKAIENAQKKVEARNFDIRKQLLEYDNVANEQRKVIYEQRNAILEADHVSEMIATMRQDVLTELVELYIPAHAPEESWQIPQLEHVLMEEFGLAVPIQDWLQENDQLMAEDIAEKILQAANDHYAAKVAAIGAETMTYFERALLLQVLDHYWREHLSALEHLRQGVHLRGYAQKDPKQEYKREAFALFANLINEIKKEVTRLAMRLEVKSEEPGFAQLEPEEVLEGVRYEHPSLEEETAASSTGPQMDKKPFTRNHDKVRRNDPCPCGSGKKYKHCHGKVA